MEEFQLSTLWNICGLFVAYPDTVIMQNIKYILLCKFRYFKLVCRKNRFVERSVIFSRT